VPHRPTKSDVLTPIGASALFWNMAVPSWSRRVSLPVPRRSKDQCASRPSPLPAPRSLARLQPLMRCPPPVCKRGILRMPMAGQNVGFRRRFCNEPGVACFRAKAAGPRPIWRPFGRVGPRSRRHRANPFQLGGECAEQPARARRTRGQLWRYRRQRLRRSRRVAANFLVGGPQNAYALQPLSVQGQTGLNVAGRRRQSRPRACRVRRTHPSSPAITVIIVKKRSTKKIMT